MKEQIYFYERAENLKQNRGLNRLNERIFQVNFQMQGWINDSSNGGS